jgi:hypothetical protein
VTRLPVTAMRLPVMAMRLPVTATRLPVTATRLPVTATRLPRLTAATQATAADLSSSQRKGVGQKPTPFSFLY